MVFGCLDVAVGIQADPVETAESVVVVQTSRLEHFQHEVALLVAFSVAVDAAASVGICASAAGECFAVALRGFEFAGARGAFAVAAE